MGLRFINTETEQLSKISVKTIEDLNLKRSFSNIFRDSKKIEIFFKQFSTLPILPEDVIYRQDIFKDFTQSPTLFFKMSDLMVRFRKVKETRDKVRKNRLRNISDPSLKTSNELARTDMNASALTLKSSLLFVKALFDLLEEFPILSKALQNLKNEAGRFVSLNDFFELIHLCDRLESFSPSEPLDIKAEFDDFGAIKNAKLIEHNLIHIEKSERKKLFARKSNVCEEKQSVQLMVSNHTSYNQLMSAPLYDLADILDQLSGQLFDRFCWDKDEEIFFEVSLAYYDFLLQKNIDITFPQFEKNKECQISDLYDLFLLTTKETKEIEPHSLVYEENSKKGYIVFGNNGSGKTVFLRSLGCMQILAQIGLPIPASKCVLKTRKNIVTVFAGADEKNLYGIGRFEQEVQKFSEVLKDIVPGSLVLMNEMFQSTSYEEGARALSEVLAYFNEDDILWFCVSHLKQLSNHFSESEITYIYLDGFCIYKK